MSKNVQDLLTATAYDNNGDKIGDVNEVFVDDASGQPTFVDVNHGLFGMGNSLVPLRGHSIDGSNLTLGFSKDRIKDAPAFDADKPLTPEQQTEIYDHYGISAAAHVEGYSGGEHPDSTHTDKTAPDNLQPENTENGAGAGVGAGVAGAGVAGAGAAGAGVAAQNSDGQPTSDQGTEIPGNTSSETTAVGSTDYSASGGAASTQTTDIPGNTAAETSAVGSADSGSAEASSADAAQSGPASVDGVQTGETRLRKYVVTETETVEVPVQREEVRVERIDETRQN